MKVAVWHNLPSGGGKRALHDHVRGLVARGHEVESWSPPTADLSYMPLSRYGAEHTVPLDEPLVRPGNRITRRWLPYRETIARIESMMRHARRCVEEIEGRGFDLILGNSCRAFSTPFLARFATIPTVLYLQESYRFFYEAGFGSPDNQLAWVAGPPRPLKSRFLLARWKEWVGWHGQEIAAVQSIRVQAREECINAHSFDRALCNSRFSREAFLRIYGRKFRVCYLGVDTGAFRLSDAPKGHYAIGLGSFGANKGIDVAIRSVAAIEPSRRPALIWIGNYAYDVYFEEIVELAESLGVNFMPKKLVGQDELIDLLGRAAVMIYTSRLEPFGYAPLEANACGTAVVGVAEGGIRETIEHGVNGLLVDDDDPVALGRAILSYTDDLDFARTEGIKAYNHILNHWRVEAAVDRLEMHLEMALRSGRNVVAGGGERPPSPDGNV